MARQFSRSTIPRPRKKLDQTAWELSTGSVSAQGTGSVAFQFSSVGTDPSTLLRIRGEVVGFTDGANAPGLGVYVAYGIILVPEGTGATVLFDPEADANAPWLLYGSSFLGYEEQVTDVIDIPGISSFRDKIDNKAMRIIRPDMEMQFVFTNASVFTAESVNLAYHLRWLSGF